MVGVKSPSGLGCDPHRPREYVGLASGRAWPGLHPLGFVRSERRRCVVRMTDEPHRQRAESSPGEGSPGAEREVLAGSPAGRTWTITKPPELVASRAGDLTPWSAGGSEFDFAGQFRSPSQLHRCPVEAHGKWLRLRPVRHFGASPLNHPSFGRLGRTLGSAGTYSEGCSSSVQATQSRPQFRQKALGC